MQDYQWPHSNSGDCTYLSTAYPQKINLDRRKKTKKYISCNLKGIKAHVKLFWMRQALLLWRGSQLFIKFGSSRLGWLALCCFSLRVRLSLLHLGCFSAGWKLLLPRTSWCDEWPTPAALSADLRRFGTLCKSSSTRFLFSFKGSCGYEEERKGNNYILTEEQMYRQLFSLTCECMLLQPFSCLLPQSVEHSLDWKCWIRSLDFFQAAVQNWGWQLSLTPVLYCHVRNCRWTFYWLHVITLKREHGLLHAIQRLVQLPVAAPLSLLYRS